MSKKWFRRVAFIVLLVAIAAVLRWTVFQPDPVPVTIFTAAAGRVEEIVANSKAGTVKTRLRATLSTEIGGLVQVLRVREGDRVEKGEVLLRLADSDYRAVMTLRQRALETARFGKSEACTNAEQAERDLVRYLRLAREEIVSEELLDNVQSKRDAAVAGCDGARARELEAAAALDLARVNLAKTVLRAPFAGIVAEVSAEEGEWITPSPPGLPIPPVVEILDNEAIYISAPLDEVDVGRVRPGRAVRITLDAYPGESFDGEVTRVAPYVMDIEEQNRTFEIEVEFVDQEFAGNLLPGASADVEVILDAAVDVLRIPSYALIEGSRALVLRDGILEEVRVEVGLKNWQFTEIREGLQEGDKVVVSLDRLEVRAGAHAEATAETDR
jgi:HlyD family secretion protein